MDTVTMDLQDFMHQKRVENSSPVHIQDMEYISVEEYARRTGMAGPAIRARLRKGRIANAIKDGKMWMIGIEPTFSREEYDKVKIENAELKATLRILAGIIKERMVI